jgi:hypothetical protein
MGEPSRYVISGIIDETGERVELFSVTAANPSLAIAKALTMLSAPWRQKLRRGSLAADHPLTLMLRSKMSS